MIPAALTGPERQVRALMGVYTVLFVLSGLTMAFAPDFVLDQMNSASRWVAPSLAEAPHDRGRVWVSLTVSMMAMISTISALNWRDVRANRGLIPLLILSKAASSVMGLGYFLAAETKYFADLAVFLIDFPLFVTTAAFYRRLMRAGAQGAGRTAPGP